MIRFLILILLVCFTVGCSKDTNKKVDKIDKVISDFVTSSYFKYDSTTIVSDLINYSYYNTKSGDSLIPPSGNPRHLNEFDVAYSIAAKDRFKGLNELNFLRAQILDSTERFKIDLDQIPQILNQKPEGVEKFIVFYRPLFNIDSNVVYLQYDLYDHGYEEGEGLILILSDGNWKLDGIVSQWNL